MTLLWYLARRSWARYESYDLPERNPDGDGLATPTFWDGRDQVGRLRSLHVAAMFALIDAILLYVLLRHDLGRRRLRRGRPGAGHPGLGVGPRPWCWPGSSRSSSAPA